MRKLTFAAAAALAVVSTAAFASVSYNPASGGFVGKGDVQTLLGLNNPKMNAAASGVTFSWDVSASYTFTCSWVTGEGTRGEKTHFVDHKTSYAVHDAVARDLRKNPNDNLTGFNLYPISGDGSDTPNLACPGSDGNGATIVDGSVSQTSVSAGLFMHYGTGSWAMPNTI
jgi:hypothetical protein